MVLCPAARLRSRTHHRHLTCHFVYTGRVVCDNFQWSDNKYKCVSKNEKSGQKWFLLRKSSNFGNGISRTTFQSCHFTSVSSWICIEWIQVTSLSLSPSIPSPHPPVSVSPSIRLPAFQFLFWNSKQMVGKMMRIPFLSVILLSPPMHSSSSHCSFKKQNISIAFQQIQINFLGKEKLEKGGIGKSKTLRIEWTWTDSMN